jgi:hypothetical protein
MRGVVKIYNAGVVNRDRRIGSWLVSECQTGDVEMLDDSDKQRS